MSPDPFVLLVMQEFDQIQRGVIRLATEVAQLFCAHTLASADQSRAVFW